MADMIKAPTDLRPPYRVALVGAGNIAEAHAEALRGLKTIRLTAVVDPDQDKAHAFAAKWRAGKVLANVDELVAAEICDAAHVLVPPDLHRPIAEPLLRAGLSVFLEKPMAASHADCRALTAAAAESGAILGVNQNFVFHAAHRKLKTVLETGRLGRLHHLVAVFNMPLRQLSAGQVGHWMFRQPQNILLEQAVHPLSQLQHLAGPAAELNALTSAPRKLAPSIDFVDTWQVSLKCADATAQLFMSFGQDFPAWQITAICQDGTATADMINDRMVLQEASRWPDFYDGFLSGAGAAGSLLVQSAGNAAGYVLSTLKLRGRSDAFFQSMKASIAAYYAALPSGGTDIDGRFGGDIVDLCERIAGKVAIAPSPPAAAAEKTDSWDVAVLGGTGFIGRHLVARLLRDGHKVGVLARGTAILPPPLDDPHVAIIRGDVADIDAVRRAIGDAKLVVNLAQGASGADVVRSMVDASTTVAEACLKSEVELLIHASTIAALYLGDPDETITGTTPTDPQREQRGEYSQAKAASEAALMALYREHGLPVCIVRPGVVVGDGGPAFHSGLGFFNRERHCMGWNDGNNALPFVLVEDVADAIALALATPEQAAGRCYNLVGDVDLTAREYIAALARALGRPLRYHGQYLPKLQAVELFKWCVKIATGRRDAPFPSYRDLKSRGMPARFDCSDVKRDLDWRPESDRKAFIDRAIGVHGPD